MRGESGDTRLPAALQDKRRLFMISPEFAAQARGMVILDAIRALDDILTRMGGVQRKSRTLMRHIHSWDTQPTRP
jgi:hypothetical protein